MVTLESSHEILAPQNERIKQLPSYWHWHHKHPLHNSVSLYLQAA